MLRKTILNRIELVYGQVRMLEEDGKLAIEVEVAARANGRPTGSGCGCPAPGYDRLTTSYRWFLARWAKRLSWQEVATVFGTTWEHVFRSVNHAVSWGLKHRDLDDVEAIGVDEIQWQRGHKDEI